MNFNPLLLIYLTPLVCIWVAWVGYAKHRTKRDLAVLEDNKAAGLGEPPSLHPVIDPALCLGCGACVKACPEKSILGIIDGKAALIEPTHCVGHGACQKSCPTDAISLVFGTETRGVDIPVLTPKFETNVSGIFIAGELGGMGLIKNAIEQGRQAIEHAGNFAKSIGGGGDVLDVFIVGSGPAGISASLGALQRKLKFRTVDQSTLGGTVAHFPRGKLVMTAPAELPLVGKVKFGEVSKEKLLEFWEQVVRDTGVELHHEEQVNSVERNGQLFQISTSKGNYQAKAILLAIGRRGTPRTLDVPGEELSKVVYRLIDPAQYSNKHVVVVGGGDSALEAAASIAEEEGTSVILSYRSEAFSRARAKNRDRVAAAEASGKLSLMLSSKIVKINESDIIISSGNGEQVFKNDAVIICAGGILPTDFLRSMGIEIQTKFGVA